MIKDGSLRLPLDPAGFLFSWGSWLVFCIIFWVVRSYGTGDTLDWMSDPASIVVVFLVASFLVGTFDWAGNLLVERTSLRSKPFRVLIVVKVSSFAMAMLGLLLLGRIVAVASGKLSWSELPSSYLAHLADERVVAGAVFLALAALIMAFVRMTSAMVGPRVLVNLLLGKYYHPREEELIFMFLDMGSSTPLAVKLGHQKFSRLLQDCFRDLSEVAIRHRVEIYKYVGDEAILSWRPRDGLLNANCVQVYFAFVETLKSRREYYESSYGCLPSFKAGLNIGPVTVAEVGVLKREIAYLSDTLNTAARIRSMCSDLGASLLLSETLRNRLPENVPISFSTVGSVSLRGKEEKVVLFEAKEPEPSP